MSDIIERLRAVRSVQPSTVRIATEAADLIEYQAADLSRLREERDALTEISGVEYCTVHDGIQIEGNSDDCDQADTDPDAECHMVALFHVAPSPDPNTVAFNVPRTDGTTATYEVPRKTLREGMQAIRENERRAAAETRDIVLGASPDPKDGEQ